MADNVELDSMSGGDVVGADDVGGVKYQEIKIVLGPNGVDGGQVAPGHDLPVTVSGLESRFGEVQANPTSNTLLARLKNIESYVDSVEAYLTTISGSLNRMNDQVAHDDIDSGNPVKIGYKAIAHGTNPTAVAAGDRTNSYANRAGIPFVIGGHPNIIVKNLNVTDGDGAQTNTDIIGSVSSGSKLVITHLAVTADNANTTDVAVRIGFGSSSVPAADSAGIVLAHPGIAAGSGVVLGNGSGILAIGGDGEELRITCEDPTGGAIDVVVGYYTIES